MSFRPQRVQMSFAPMIDLANSTPSVAGTAFNALGKGLVDLGVRKKNQQTAQAQAAKEKAELETQRAYNKIINPKFGKEFEVAKKNNPNIDMGLIKLSPPKAETWQKPIIDGSGEFVSMSNLGNVKKLDLSPKKPTRSIQTRDIRVKGVNYIAKYNPANDRFENTWQKSANQPSQKSTNNEVTKLMKDMNDDELEFVRNNNIRHRRNKYGQVVYTFTLPLMKRKANPNKQIRLK